MQCVSVVIPALNNANTIAETLKSCLKEPEVGEVIVVVAPSTDDTTSVVRSVVDNRVRVIEPGVKGIARQMNIGLAHAQFDFICKIDADDLAVEGRFWKQVKFLNENVDYIAIAGALLRVDMTGKILCNPIVRYEIGDVTNLYLSACEVAHLGTLLMRTCSVRDIGGFREWFTSSEDYDLCFRLAESGKIWLSDDPVYGFRIRPNSITHSQAEKLTQFYADMAREFRRQRELTGADDLSRGQPPPLPSVYGNDKPFDPRRRLSNSLEVGAWHDFDRGQRKSGLSKMLQSVKEAPKPLRLQKARSLLVMICKFSFKKTLKKSSSAS